MIHELRAPTGNRINKLWSVHTVQYYSAIKETTTQMNR